MCLVQQKKKELYGHKQKIIDQSKGLQLIYYTVEKKKEININCQTLKCKRKRVWVNMSPYFIVNDIKPP